MAHKWVHSSAYSSIPPDAIFGGNDVNGDVMYVGRAFHNGDMLVAKVIPAKQIAFVPWRGEEIPKESFEVLCGQNLHWRHCYDHVIPENAILCGRTALDQPVYVGRGHYEGSLTVGKVSSVHRALFIPFRGVERRLETYELLVDDTPTPGWSVSTAPLPPPPPTLLEKPLLDIKPALPYSPPYPMPQPQAPALDTKPTMYVPVLPMPPPSYNPPAYAPPSFEPPPPYNPTTHVHAPSRPHVMWVTAGPGYMPPNAVHAGHDADLATIYVCRAFHEGNFIPGKLIPSRSCAYISYGGQEIPKYNYEVLVGDRYQWVPAYNGNVVPGAVEAGRSNNGEPLFIGRAHFSGTLTPGKIQRSHQCLYIPFGGQERRITSYEVLVNRDAFYRNEAMAMHY